MHTHTEITDKELRSVYAEEFNELRQTHMWWWMTNEERRIFRLGFDSAFWAMQKRMNRRAHWKLANWSCPECGYINDGQMLDCYVCKEPRK